MARSPLARRAARPARFRPTLLALESRLAPAAFSWYQNVNGDFNDPSRWIDQDGHNGVPGAGDTASIGFGSIIVTVSGGTSVRSLSDSARIVHTAGTLTFGANSNLAEYDQSAGASLAVPSNVTVTLGNNTQLAGTSTVEAFGTLSLYGFVLTGGIDAAATSTVGFYGADMRVNPGGHLDGAGTYTLYGSVFYGPVLTFNTDVTVQNLTVTTNGGTAGDGNLTVTHNLTFVSGSIGGSVTATRTVAAGATMTIDGVQSHSIDHCTLLNLGTASWINGASLGFANAGIFNNEGTADLSTDSNFAVGNGTFNNDGTLNKTSTAATGTSYFGATFGGTFTNSGTVHVLSGTFEIDGTGVAGGTFSADANATVRFANSGAGYTLNGGAVLTGAGFVRLNGGDNGYLRLNGDVTATNFAIDSGSVIGTGSLTVSGTLSWAGGRIGGSSTVTIGDGASLTLSGTTTKALDESSVLNNYGTATWTGTGTFGIAQSATFNNFNTFTDHADHRLDSYLYDFSPPGTFNNAGVYSKTGGTGTTFVGDIFNNSGYVSVQSGTLRLNAGGTNTGTLDVADGAFLSVTSTSRAFNLNAGTLLPDTGPIQVGGLLTVNFDVSVYRLQVNGGTLNGPATVSVSGDLLWTGGTMAGTGTTVVLDTATLELSGSGAKVIDEQRDLLNLGTGTWSGTGNFSIAPAARFDNANTFTVQNDQRLDSYPYDFSPPGTVNNSGFWVKTSPTGSGTTYVGSLFNNTGYVLVASGTLQLNRGGTGGGTFDVAGGGSLTFTAGTYTLNDGASFVDAGSARIAGGTLYVNGTVTAVNLALDSGTLDGTGSLTVSGGTFDWTGGSIANVNGAFTLAGDATMTIRGNADKALSGRTLNIDGAATWDDSGNLNLSAGGTINVRASGSLTVRNDRSVTGNGSVSIAGTFVKAGGVGSTLVAGGVRFTNDDGAVLLLSGTLNVTGGYTQNAGSTLLAAGTTLAGNVNVAGGTLSGVGTINGDLTNSGTVSVGDAADAGVLVVTGNYTQTSIGTLIVKVAGPGSGTDYDRLQVNGQASLAGTLKVEMGGYAPPSGTGFQVLTYAGHTGSFGTVTVDGTAGVALDPQYDGTGLNLVTM